MPLGHVEEQGAKEKELGSADGRASGRVGQLAKCGRGALPAGIEASPAAEGAEFRISPRSTTGSSAQTACFVPFWRSRSVTRVAEREGLGAEYCLRTGKGMSNIRDVGG